jgi:hypothetical protein
MVEFEIMAWDRVLFCKSGCLENWSGFTGKSLGNVVIIFHRIYLNGFAFWAN